MHKGGKRRSLLIRLGVPLLALFGITMWMHYEFGADGFFLNLATEIIGIGVTVAYVDRILRRHEAEEWGSVRSIIDGRIRLASNAGLTVIRSALGVDELPGWNPLGETLSDSGYRALLRREFVPGFSSRIAELTQNGWKELAAGLNRVSSDADVILRTFGGHLRANEYSTLLDIQDEIRRILLTYGVESRLYGSDYVAQSPADIVSNEFITREAIKEVGAVVERLLHLGDLVPDEPRSNLIRRA